MKLAYFFSILLLVVCASASAQALREDEQKLNLVRTFIEKARSLGRTSSPPTMFEPLSAVRDLIAGVPVGEPDWFDNYKRLFGIHDFAMGLCKLEGTKPPGVELKFDDVRLGEKDGEKDAVILSVRFPEGAMEQPLPGLRSVIRFMKVKVIDPATKEEREVLRIYSVDTQKLRNEPRQMPGLFLGRI